MSNLLSGFLHRHRITIKGFLVGILILILLIPTAFIYQLIIERKGRQAEVSAEVSSKWAGPQTISGPFLMIPYEQQVKDQQGKIQTVRHITYFLPEQLNISGNIIPEIRSRSIYKVILYKTNLQLNGNFSAKMFFESGINKDVLL